MYYVKFYYIIYIFNFFSCFKCKSLTTLSKINFLPVILAIITDQNQFNDLYLKLFFSCKIFGTKNHQCVRSLQLRELKSQRVRKLLTQTSVLDAQYRSADSLRDQEKKWNFIGYLRIKGQKVTNQQTPQSSKQQRGERKERGMEERRKARWQKSSADPDTAFAICQKPSKLRLCQEGMAR